MISFNKYCVKEEEYNDECVKSAFDAVGGLEKDEIDECMEDSFASTGGKIKDNTSDNRLLKIESDLKRDLGLQYYPAVVINGEVYRVRNSSTN